MARRGWPTERARLWRDIQTHHIAVFLAVELVLGLVVFGYAQRVTQQHTARDVEAQLRHTELQLAILKAIGNEMNTHAVASENRNCATATMLHYIVQIEEQKLSKQQQTRLDAYVRVACSYTLPSGRSSICPTPPKPNTTKAATSAHPDMIPSVLTSFAEGKPRVNNVVRAYVFHREGSTHRSKKIGYGGLDDALDGRLEQGEGPYRMGRLRSDGTYVKDTLTNWRTSNEAVRYFPPHLRDAHVGSTWRIASKTRPNWALRIKVRTFTIGEQVIRAAKTQLGVRYVWGAEQKDVAFDCSGLTAWAWSTVGVNLPHNAEAQRQICTKVSTPKQGDLVFFDFNGSGQASHVGLFLRTGYTIDTRNPDGEPVEVRPIEKAYVIGYGRPPGI